jgi:hypothetical protein
MAKDGELLTAGKLAEKLGVSAGKVKKALQELSIQPDLVKGGCNYYSSAVAKKIEKAVK